MLTESKPVICLADKRLKGQIDETGVYIINGRKGKSIPTYLDYHVFSLHLFLGNLKRKKLSVCVFSTHALEI